MATIQWFPGHMAKARRQITEKIKLVDIIIELLDARIPISSRNPMIDQIVQQKPRIILLNKSDLADPTITDQWVSYFKEQGLKAIPINSTGGRGLQVIVKDAESILSEKREAMIKRGINPRAIRAMILGIPNVGKSTLINSLAKKGAAKTGDRPGVTKGQQWIKIGNAMELLDTPGILWPKFEDQNVGLRLAATGAIKDELLHFDDVALFIVEYFKQEYPERLKERYGLTELPEDKIMLIEEIGKKRGCLISGGNVDFDKAAEIIIRDLRSGKLGTFTLEKP